MTTIAWDGKTLAGDKQSTSGNTPTVTVKVAKIKRGKEVYLVGFCGRLADGQAFFRFVERDFQDAPPINDLSAMVIKRDGTVTTYSDVNANPCALGKLDYWAVGSGSDYALGAMAFGATAEQAIEVATKLDIYTGMGIDTVSFS